MCIQFHLFEIYISSQMLRNLLLKVKLEKLQEWILELQNLVKLKLENS